MLKFAYENKTEIPEGLESYYSEKDGKFTLKVEGVKSEADVAALKEITDKERKLRRDAEAKVKEYDSKYSELPEDFDIDHYHDLKNGVEKGNQSAKEIREAISKSYEKKMADLQVELDGARGDVNKYVKTGTLQKVMVDNNISKAYMPAVEALMRDKIKVEGGEVFLDERPITDAFKDWSNSDEGKHYVSASQNSGGGADGKFSGGTAKTIDRASFDQKNASEKMQMMKDGVKVVNA